jgi:hypothetical protein
MIDREFFLQLCLELRYPQLDGTFDEPTNVFVARFLNVSPDTPPERLIELFGAAFADHAHADTMEAMVRKAAHSAARSRGRLLSKQVGTMQKAVAEALLKLGDNATDAEVRDYLVKHKKYPLSTRPNHVKRARDSLHRRGSAF